ncbi:exopolygalacturonase-like [Gossypium australe]|uniref:Polygalacturonase n=1 Tax=Gossypium australe TaxID=47621 RepID=A0A5B6UFJ4_9ROSI|nr:exopolygalacturonase-like [Gossypium australe]KAA3455677.1 exopolygalacturonase-like [Gossypium australe]
MASMRLLAIIAILVQGLVIGDSQELPSFDPELAVAKVLEVAEGKVGPDVKIFNVVDFGAKPDGTTISTINFIRAFKEACNHNGRAMLVIPEGNFLLGSTLFSGPCTFQPPLMVQFNGNLLPQGSTATAENADWITFMNFNGLFISGKGTINGQGDKEAWNAVCDGCRRKAANLKLIKLNDVLISGITSLNAKGFHMMISVCNNFVITNVNISAPDESPNTDGIHMSKTNKVRISDSTIGTGDDCVSMIHGTTNVTIENVHCGPGHGFSIGSLGHYDAEFDVFGITVRNCSLAYTENGARIKTYRNESPSKASGIIFQDLTMDHVKNPILIDQEYATIPGSVDSKVLISDVEFSNIRGTTISKIAVVLACSTTFPCKGITLKDIHLTYAGDPGHNEDTPFSSNCTNVKVNYIGEQMPPPCA